MTQSVKAILARFKGDNFEAQAYCRHMMATYPHLREEYRDYEIALRREEIR